MGNSQCEIWSHLAHVIVKARKGAAPFCNGSVNSTLRLTLFFRGLTKGGSFSPTFSSSSPLSFLDFALNSHLLTRLIYLGPTLLKPRSHDTTETSLLCSGKGKAGRHLSNLVSVVSHSSPLRRSLSLCHQDRVQGTGRWSKRCSLYFPR
jgi:hypothetical protein